MVDFLQSYPLGPNVLTSDVVLSSSFEDTAEQLLKDLEKGTHIFEVHEVYIFWLKTISNVRGTTPQQHIFKTSPI